MNPGRIITSSPALWSFLLTFIFYILQHRYCSPVNYSLIVIRDMHDSACCSLASERLNRRLLLPNAIKITFYIKLWKPHHSSELSAELGCLYLTMCLKPVVLQIHFNYSHQSAAGFPEHRDPEQVWLFFSPLISWFINLKLLKKWERSPEQ